MTRLDPGPQSLVQPTRQPQDPVGSSSSRHTRRVSLAWPLGATAAAPRPQVGLAGEGQNWADGSWTPGTAGGAGVPEGGIQERLEAEASRQEEAEPSERPGGPCSKELFPS